MRTLEESTLCENPIVAHWCEGDTEQTYKGNVSMRLAYIGDVDDDEHEIAIEWKNKNSCNVCVPSIYWFADRSREDPTCVQIDGKLFVDIEAWQKAYIDTYCDEAYKDDLEDEVRKDIDVSSLPWACPWLADPRFDYCCDPASLAINNWRMEKEEVKKCCEDNDNNDDSFDIDEFDE